MNQRDVELDDELHEVAIVCFAEESMEMAKLTYTVKAVLIFTSVAFLVLTLYIYFVLKELRETQVTDRSVFTSGKFPHNFNQFQDKVTIFTLINLTTFLFYLGIMQVQTPVDSWMNICVSLAFIVYFFTMGYFAWLNCVMANVWKTIV